MFSADEVAAATTRHSELAYHDDGYFEGFLELHARFVDDERKDRFHVRIDPATTAAGIPSLTEIGGRTADVARKHGVRDLRDLHRNPNGCACLCARQAELKRCPPGSGVSHFIEELAVPYLYGLSYFDEHGRWPWPEYSHGSLGAAEYYADEVDEPSEALIRETVDILAQDSNWRECRRQIRRPRRNLRCVCRSGRPIRLCHVHAFAGLQKLSEHAKKLGVDVRNLFPR